MRLALSHLDSALGRLSFAVCEGALCALDFTESHEAVDAPLRARLEARYPGALIESAAPEARPELQRVAEQLRAYFAGQLQALDELRVEARGTDFQRRVWAALRRIPAGHTTSYGAIAAELGNPGAVRAVGMANGRNPVALVVPCHRVIASDGTLCGYAGGLWRKEWLLRHEKALLA